MRARLSFSISVVLTARGSRATSSANPTSPMVPPGISPLAGTVSPQTPGMSTVAVKSSASTPSGTATKQKPGAVPLAKPGTSSLSGTAAPHAPGASTPYGAAAQHVPGASAPSGAAAQHAPGSSNASGSKSTAAADPEKLYPAAKHARLTAAAKAKGKATDPIDVDSGDVEVVLPEHRKPRQATESAAMDVDPPRGRPSHRHSDIGPRTRSVTRGESAEAGSTAHHPHPSRNTKRKSETPGPSNKKPRMEDEPADEAGGSARSDVPPEPGFPPENILRTWEKHVSVQPDAGGTTRTDTSSFQPSHCATCQPDQCYFIPMWGAVCGPCQRKHSKCSLNMGVFQTSKFVTGYLSWRYSKQLADPAKYPEPELLPEKFKSLSRDLIPTWFIEQVEAARTAGKPDPFELVPGASGSRPGRGRSRRRVPAGRMSRTASSAASDGGDASPQVAQSAPSTPARSPKFGPDFDGPGYTEIDEDLAAVPMVALSLLDSAPMDVDPAESVPPADETSRSRSKAPVRDHGGRHPKELALMPPPVPGKSTSSILILIPDVGLIGTQDLGKTFQNSRAHRKARLISPMSTW